MSPHPRNLNLRRLCSEKEDDNSPDYEDRKFNRHSVKPLL